MGMKPAILQLGNSINERKEKMDAIKLNHVYDDLRQYIFFISIQISIQIIIFDRKTNDQIWQTYTFAMEWMNLPNIQSFKFANA